MWSPRLLHFFLQVKERLITSLQSGEGGPQATYEAKLEEMRLGKEHLQAQLQTAHQQLENMKADLRVRGVLSLVMTLG